MRLIKKYPYLAAADAAAVRYPSPSNFTYFWSFGVFSLTCLVVQIVTGIFLAMHYCPDITLAFVSVEHIMRDVNYGWLVRYIHANGASMFFLVVYTHMFRGLYYSSFVRPRHFLWLSGVLIMFIMIVTAFMGYVLPWGQMSFWAATVITNLMSAIPFIGNEVVIWLWGGYSVGNATLSRFFALHYLLPFIILAIVVVHILLLHEYGSNNPLGVDAYPDSVYLTPYYIVKDIFSIVMFFILFALFVYFVPNYLGHPDNYIPANPLVTPPHIVPEWYLLPFYAILRSIPDKLGGVVALLAAILVLAFVPILLEGDIRGLQHRYYAKPLFFSFLVICLMLGWLGAQPIKTPYYQLGQITTFLYFAYFLVLYPFVIKVEKELNIIYLEEVSKEYEHMIERRLTEYGPAGLMGHEVNPFKEMLENLKK
jgi:quinol-cytochrome oxidoreductase complex cytochrome b subunit